MGSLVVAASADPVTRTSRSSVLTFIALELQPDDHASQRTNTPMEKHRKI
jgi:hypothetical protein